MAAHVMRDVLADPDAVFEAMPYFAFKGGFSETMPSCGQVLTRDGASLLLSRTGYTGEFGFEIFTSADTIVDVWEAVMAAGAHYGAIPCGLAARDSLRAGAVLPLSHQDIGDWPFCNHPWPFALPYRSGTDDFTKTFLGDTALKTDRAPYTYPIHRGKSAESDPAGRGAGCRGPGHRGCVDLRHRYGYRMARGSRFEHRQPRCARGIHARRTLLRVCAGGRSTAAGYAIAVERQTPRYRCPHCGRYPAGSHRTQTATNDAATKGGLIHERAQRS
jgi:predicted RNA-binding Zn-ribbon protein involved in translation (DUF1610 family)